MLPGTATRLERGLPADRSIFDLYPHVIVSTDFIKSDQRRLDFLRTCPDLVIVDETHTCSSSGRTRHHRQRLIAELAEKPERHLILVTATPCCPCWIPRSRTSRRIGSAITFCAF